MGTSHNQNWYQIKNKHRHPKELIIGDISHGVRTRSSHGVHHFTSVAS